MSACIHAVQGAVAVTHLAGANVGAEDTVLAVDAVLGAANADLAEDAVTGAGEATVAVSSRSGHGEGRHEADGDESDELHFEMSVD